MQDQLVRVVSSDGLLRAAAVVTTSLVTDVCTRHQTDLTATVALGRLVTGGALLSCLLKGQQRLALMIEGNGPLGKLSVEADANARVRGSIRNPHAGLPPKDGRFDVAGAVGKAGFLHVFKDLGLKEPYQSMVQLQSSEIAEDLAWYLSNSEQVPSSIGLGVELGGAGEVSVAGGFLVQALPPGNEDQIDGVIERIEKMAPITTLLKEGLAPLEILKTVFGGVAFSIQQESPVSFFCPCNDHQITGMLISLGREELIRLAEEQENVEVICEYCRKKYQFERPDIEKMVKKI